MLLWLLCHPRRVPPIPGKVKAQRAALAVEMIEDPVVGKGLKEAAKAAQGSRTDLTSPHTYGDVKGTGKKDSQYVNKQAAAKMGVSQSQVEKTAYVAKRDPVSTTVC